MKKSVSQLKTRLALTSRKIKQAKASGNRRQLNLARLERINLWRELRDEHGMAPPRHVAKELEKRDKETGKKPTEFTKARQEKKRDIVWISENEMDFTRLPKKELKKLYASAEAAEKPRVAVAKKELIPGRIEELSKKERNAAERWFSKNISEYGKTSLLKKKLARRDRPAVSFLREAKEGDPFLKDAFDISYTAYAKMLEHLKKKNFDLAKKRKEYLKKFEGKNISHFLALYNNRATSTQIEIYEFEKLMRSRKKEAKEIGYLCKVVSEDEMQVKIGRLNKKRLQLRVQKRLNKLFAEEIDKIEEQIMGDLGRAEGEEAKELKQDLGKLQNIGKQLKKPGARISKVLARIGLMSSTDAMVMEAAATRRYGKQIAKELAMGETKGGGVKMARAEPRKHKKTKKKKPEELARAERRGKEAKA